MSDPTHPSDDLDEVLSSVLDGEADDATRARIESDPASLARLEQLRRARDLVAVPVVALDEVTARRLRETALDSNRPASSPPTAATGRAGFGRWIASAAAVLLLLVVAGPVLSRLADQSSDDGDEASVALDAGDSAESSGPVPEAADTGGSALNSGEIATEPAAADLGTYPSDDALGDAAIAAEEQTADADRSSADAATSDDDLSDESGGSPTESELERDLIEGLDATASSCPIDTGSGVIASFSGTVGGQERLARVLRDETGALSVLIIDPATCSIVARRP